MKHAEIGCAKLEQRISCEQDLREGVEARGTPIGKRWKHVPVQLCQAANMSMACAFFFFPVGVRMVSVEVLVFLVN